MIRREYYALAATILLTFALPAAAEGVRLSAATEVTIALPGAAESYLKVAGQPMAFTTHVDLREAVGDLQKYLSQICGVRTAVAAYGPALRGVVIHVGRTAFVEKQKLGLDALDIEGFVIRTTGQHVILAGRTRLGTRHAVYTFLERHCGVRWIFPHELGTHVPKSDALVVPALAERHNPAFLSRYFTVHRMAGWREWHRRNKVQDHWTNRLKGNSHSMAAIIPSKVHGKEHPEYFALVKGTRRVPGGPVPEYRAAYCLTNPHVIDLCVKWATDYFDKYPDVASVSMAMNDTTVTCECGPCRREGVDGAANGPTYSDRYFAFLNKVARRVKARHPDKVIGVLGYGPTRTVPTRLRRLEDNINIYLVTGGTGSLDPAYRKTRDALLQQWTGHAPSLCIYTYQFGTSRDRFYQIPAYYPSLVHEELVRLHRSGVKGSVTEMLPFWPFSPRPWLTAQWLWDPSRSYDDLMKDFCTTMFGKAAGDMRTYFDTLEKAWMKQPRDRSTSGQDSQYDIIRPYVEALEGRLASAHRKADSALARDRVRFYADGLKTSRLFAASADIIGTFTPYPDSAEEILTALRGTQKLHLNEKAIEAHRDLLEKKYGIGRNVIAPRDKTATLRKTVAQCANVLEKRGLKKEAALLRSSPAARIGQKEKPPPKTPLPSPADGPTVENAIAQVLAREKAIVAIFASTTPAGAPRAPVDPIRYVDRTKEAMASGAKLLVRESFDSAKAVAANGGSVYGSVRFDPGVASRSAFLGSQDAMVSYPIEKLDPMAGTVELFLKTHWAGRDEDALGNVMCTGGNFDPPGHLSIRISGKPGKRRLSFTIYAVGVTTYVLVPMKNWQENAWHHVAAMWRVDPKKPGTNTIELYLDGKLTRGAPARIRKATSVKPKGPLAFGNRPVRTVRHQSLPLLSFDELRIYDRPIPREALSFQLNAGRD